MILRSAIFVVVSLLLVVLQGQLFLVLEPLHALLSQAQAAAVAALGRPGWSPLRVDSFSPSLVLPLIVYLGVQEPSMVRGAALSFAAGFLLDVASSAPLGLMTFVSVATWGLARLAGVRLTAQTLLPRMTLAFAFTVVQGLMIVVLFAVFGRDPKRPLELGAVIIPHALATALASPLVFRLAQRLQSVSTVAARGK